MRFPFERLGQRIKQVGDHIHRETIPQCDWMAIPEERSSGLVPAPEDARWRAFSVGQWWGQDDGSPWIWFRTEITIPDGWSGRRVVLAVRLAEPGSASYPEALAYVNAAARQGIDQWHSLVYLQDKARVGERFDVALETWRGRDGGARRFAQADLVWIDDETEAFYFDASVALEVAQSLPEQDYVRTHLIDALEAAFLVVDFREPIGEAFYASVRRARRRLRDEIDAVPLPPRHERVCAVGHAHIDVAWLWPLSQTRQKAARTFSTVLRLMERYPGYHFMASQAQLYQYIAEDYPEILAGIKQRVRQGRWEVNGGTWVEMDTNTTGGESLVRQFLYGRRFFREILGKEGDILWLPDVFGYSGALPQIIKRAGLSYFMTTKISWSQYNRFPYDTFYWKGIDGTRVLTHFVTAPCDQWFYTYNGDLSPSVVMGTWAENRSKNVTDEVLLTYGWGDGGGGPTSEMLERGGRLAHFPGAPRVVLGTANDFFKRLDAHIGGKRVPVWEGELYLEYHRGTLTSQARNKRANRKSEILYHQAEALATVAALLGEAYPTDQLRRGWELILLNQFHDILPGSSIHAVYEDSARDYARIAEIGETVRDAAMQAIAAHIKRPPGEDAVVVFNTLGKTRTDLVEITRPIGSGEEGYPWPPALVDAETGEEAPLQHLLGEPGEHRFLMLARKVPAYGYRTYRWQSQRGGREQSDELSVSTRGLETPYLRIALDQQGHILSCYDKVADREVLAEGERGNVLQVFEDKPLRFDAWNIDISYQDKMWEIGDLSEAHVIEEGPLRVGLELRRRYRQSSIVQRCYAYAHTPRLDIETVVDWHERHVLLKVAFPVRVHSSRATYEIQFGSVERPTHWNTSWDYARFEVCGHRWADISEGNYGVSLLNDCKYGHDIKGHMMRLTLIKCATSPDPEADQGLHRFTYSLLPHSGDWRHSTVGEAARLNDPLLHAIVAGGTDARGPALPPKLGLASCDADHVVLDTVKAAEDGDGLVVRLYEAYGQRGAVRLSFAPRLANVWECNLVEEDERSLSIQDNSVVFQIRPYEIMSFRVRFLPSGGIWGSNVSQVR